jgi:SOS-response transcriptional repressor LexA
MIRGEQREMADLRSPVREEEEEEECEERQEGQESKEGFNRRRSGQFEQLQNPGSQDRQKGDKSRPQGEEEEEEVPVHSRPQKGDPILAISKVDSNSLDFDY